MKLRIEIDPREADGSRVRVDAHSHANTPFGDSAHVDPASGVRCWTFGYFVDPSLYAGDRAAPARAAGERYRAGGIEAALTANGVFAVVVEDPAADRVWVGSDKLGLFPLFFAREGARWVFTNHYPSLLDRDDLAVDADGLEEFLVLGYSLADRTFCRQIRRLDAASYLGFDASNEKSAGRTAGLAGFDQGDRRDEAACVADAIETFREVVGDLLKMAPAPICMLSGGYDSRRIFLEMRHQGAHPPTFTIEEFKKGSDDPVSIEAAIAAELTAGNGGLHTTIPFGSGASWTATMERRNQRFGLQTNIGEWLLTLVDRLEAGSGTNFDGFAGDSLCNADLAICSQEVTHWWKDLPRVGAHFGRNRYARYLSEGFRGALSAPLGDRVAEVIGRIPEGPHRLHLFEVLGRGRASTSIYPLLAMAEKIGSVLPYVDDRMLRSAMAVDPVWKDEVQFQRLVLQRAYPEFASVPSSHDSLDAIPDRYKRRLESALPQTAAARRVSPRIALRWAQLRHALEHRPGDAPGLLSGKGRLMMSLADWACRLGLERWRPSTVEYFWSVPDLVQAERMLAKASPNYSRELGL